MKGGGPGAAHLQYPQYSEHLSEKHPGRYEPDGGDGARSSTFPSALLWLPPNIFLWRFHQEICPHSIMEVRFQMDGVSSERINARATVLRVNLGKRKRPIAMWQITATFNRPVALLTPWYKNAQINIPYHRILYELYPLDTYCKR